MGTNRDELMTKFKNVLNLSIYIAVAVTIVMCVIIQPRMTEYFNDRKPADITAINLVIILACVFINLIFSSALSEIIVRIIEFISKKKAGELHGWWIYCFLFPATDIDKKRFVCFDENGTEKVLVVGFIEVHHDSFQFFVKNDMGTSKTFNKITHSLHNRVDLKILNVDFRNDDLVVVYRTVKSPFVNEYKGIMDWHTRVDKILIEKSLSEPTKLYAKREALSYKGLIQDLEAQREIIENQIYLQHLKYEKTQDDVEELLKNHAKLIIEYIKDNYNAQEI